MDFSLDDEQRALRDLARSLLGKAYGDAEQRRAVTAKTPGFDRRLHRDVGRLGLLGLAVPERFGGSGAGLLEVGLVAKEFGRALAPEPYVTTVVLASALMAAEGADEQRERLLPSLREGELVIAWAHWEPGHRWRATAEGVTARPAGNGWIVTGTKEPVLHGAEADALIVSAALPSGGTGLFVVPGDAAGLHGTGSTSPGAGRVARLVFDETPAAPLGRAAVDAETVIAHMLALGQVMTGQEAVGAMETTLAMTTAYLTQRQQFGTTLNHFQALTFRAADMYVDVELTESIVQWATLVAAEEPAELLEAGPRVAVQVGSSARRIAQEAIQLHGGIGMTSEHPVGAFAQRLTALTQLIGTRDHHLAELAGRVHTYGTLDPLQ